jgi:hypothetical protein
VSWGLWMSWRAMPGRSDYLLFFLFIFLLFDRFINHKSNRKKRAWKDC